jgi:hypothetical protein
MVGDQFRLTYMVDPAGSGYRLNSSNPGQFYYNVFHSGEVGADFNLTITIPYPFVTQGANPIQAHDWVDFTSPGGCFIPGPNFGATITTDGGNKSPNGAQIILIGDYLPQTLGTETRIYVSGKIPATGFVYVTIHLDYGLKGTSGWMKDTDGKTATNGVNPPAVNGPITILSPQEYLFFAVRGSVRDEARPQSLNEFKKFAGFGGVVENCNGVLQPGVKVKIYGPATNGSIGPLIPGGEVLTDAEGVYLVAYKHTGKQANFTVQLPAFLPGLTRTVPVKSNSFAIVNFIPPLPGEVSYCVPVGP